MKKYFLSLCPIFLAVLVAGCCHGASGTAGYRKIKIAKLAADPAKMQDSRVEVTGFLENLGNNYFTDLQLALKDEKGRSIPVAAWLPVEVPPLRPGSDPRSRPALISDLLGKRVKLWGIWEKNEVDGSRAFILKVEKHEIIIEGGR